MPIDDLTALGQIMRKARKEKDLTHLLTRLLIFFEQVLNT